MYMECRSKIKKDNQPCHSTSYIKKLKADRFRKYNPLSKDNEINEKEFINDFICTLPHAAPNSMMEQILEIQYDDYDVDMDYLKLITVSAFGKKIKILI